MTTEFGRRLKQARKHAGFTQKQLAPRVGMSQSNLSELETIAHESGKTPQLAEACGVNAFWLATGVGQMLDEASTVMREPRPSWDFVHPPEGGTGSRGRGMSLAQELSLRKNSNEPVVLDWSQTLIGDLPPRFSLTILDDSMVLLDPPPSMRPGDLAIFSPATSATPGAIVLVADQHDNVYIRRYAQRTPGRWQAIARNDAYQSLDSAADQLRILAVQVGGLWA